MIQKFDLWLKYTLQASGESKETLMNITLLRNDIILLFCSLSCV